MRYVSEMSRVFGEGDAGKGLCYSRPSSLNSSPSLFTYLRTRSRNHNNNWESKRERDRKREQERKGEESKEKTRLQIRDYLLPTYLGQVLVLVTCQATPLVVVYPINWNGLLRGGTGGINNWGVVRPYGVRIIIALPW